MTKQFDLENERAVVVAALKDSTARRRAVGSVEAEDFQGPRYRVIFHALVECERRDIDPDIDSIAVLAEGEDFGGLDFLRMLFDLDKPKNIEMHLERLRLDSARARVLDSDVREFTDLLRDRTVSHSDCQKKAADIAGALRAATPQRGDAAEEWIENLDERCAGELPFVSVGYESLDSVLIDGFAKGNLSVLAGRTGNGKSTFVVDCVRRLLTGPNKPRIGVFAMEIGRIRFLDKLFSSATLIPTRKLRKHPHELTLEERDEIRTVAKKMVGTDDRLVVLDNPFFNLSERGQWVNDEALDKTEELLAEGNYDITFWDLWQRSLSRITPNDVETAIYRVQHMARKYRTHFCMVHQIARRAEERKDKRPRRDDLKGSGGYEEAPDLMLLIHREKTYKPFMRHDDIEIRIGKQRDDDAGMTMVAEFFPQVSRLEDDKLAEPKEGGGSSKADFRKDEETPF
jgi:replicative DNA helicase